MKIFEYILKPKTTVACSLETAYPVQSDTLMGHIFWQIYYDRGAEFLSKLKQELKAGALLAVSSPFPTGFLPKPKLPQQTNENLTLQEAQEAKKQKKLGVMPIEHLQEIINNLTFKNLHAVLQKYQKQAEAKQENPWLESLVIKVAINRKTFKALENQLFTQREYAFNTLAYSSLSLYFVSNLESLDHHKFSTYLNNVFTSGYGKRASTGKGFMEIVEVKEAQLPQAEKPNAFMVLGNYLPTQEEINKHKLNGWYILSTKFGKLGDKKAKSHNPFKKPLLMYEPGSIFKMPPVEPVIGGIVENICDDPAIWQHGQTLCLGVTIDE